MRVGATIKRLLPEAIAATILLVGVLYVATSFPMGSGSRVFARLWRWQLLACQSLDEVKRHFSCVTLGGTYGGTIEDVTKPKFWRPYAFVKSFPDGRWIACAYSSSHGGWGGGTVVSRDSAGETHVFFGHVCGGVYPRGETLEECSASLQNDEVGSFWGEEVFRARPNARDIAVIVGLCVVAGLLLWKRWARKLACACLLLAATLLCFPAWRPKPPDLSAGVPTPPDLSTCTRLEVRYLDGALYHFFFGGPYWQDWLKTVLNEEERAGVRSYDTWTVTNREQIKAFADDVRQGTYVRKHGWRTRGHGTQIVCWRDSECIASLSLSAFGHSMLTADENQFRYSGGKPDLTILEPAGIKPLKARWSCVENLSDVGRWSLTPVPRRPLDPNHWCDSALEGLRDPRTNPAGMRVSFTCPSRHRSVDANEVHPQPADANGKNEPVGARTSDYAMNPNSRGLRNSPKDMVFLFESKPGWNQHGGPELFTFDNHDPKGGLVLLNDGTVKFIRTEEELKQLRWK
jgi:hypothetical protein